MPTKSTVALIGYRAEVYWNLHKNLYSVRALSGPYKGRVVAHTDSIDLYDVTFAVQLAGRNRVLAEGRKNVHAFVRGVVSSGLPHETTQVVTYNPYKYETFVDADTKRPVTKAHIVKARAHQGKAFLTAL
jgi:hypothetical protein